VKYSLNASNAKEADTLSSRITQTGAYTGTFTVAKEVTSPKGTKGIEFSFVSVAGQEANYLTLWTHNAHGEEIFGKKQLDALLCCLKVRTIESMDKKVDVYDFASKTTQNILASVYPELMNKPVGVVLQLEEYRKNNGDTGSRMLIYRFFEAATRRTASEVLDNAEPKNLDLIMASVKDKLLQAQSAPAAAPAGGYDFNDDIDF
jgi:hypothetical protein